MSHTPTERQLSERELAAIERGHWVLDDLIADLTELKNGCPMGGATRIKAEVTIYTGGTSSLHVGKVIRKEWQYKVRCQFGKIGR